MQRGDVHIQNVGSAVLAIVVPVMLGDPREAILKKNVPTQECACITQKKVIMQPKNWWCGSMFLLFHGEHFGRFQAVSFQGSNTPPKFNMEPENDGFQKKSPFPGADFQVPC